MGQKKLIRFAELETFKNVLQYPKDIKGKWADFFQNKNDLTLELACGKGEYALGLGRLYPYRNFLGIDIKGNRLWRGAKTALEENLNNVGFMRAQIDKIEDYFLPGEVAEIWITFPDPQLRFSKVNKRLTHPKYLRFYRNILKEGAAIHLKTDSPDLYRFTLAVIEYYQLTTLEFYNDLYLQADLSPELTIKTYYERLDIAGTRKVYYLKFLVDKHIPVDQDKIFKAWLKSKDMD